MPMMQVPFGNYGASVNRIQPLRTPQQYKTYSMAMPLRSHWRLATCAEFQCRAYLRGWATTVDLDTDLGKQQYEYITHDKTRSYSMQRHGSSLVKFVYEPGQPCFASSSHRIPAARPPIFSVASGDFRAFGQRRVHQRAEDWVEDFSEHQDSLITRIQRG